MDRDRLRAGVVGVGHLGRIHARVYSELEGVELVGVADADDGRAAAVAGELSTESYEDPDRLIAAGVDVVSLAVPTVAHAELGIRLLENGCHLLVEKPIASTLDEADRMIRAAEAAGRVLQVGHLERFNPAYTALAPLLGRPLFIEVHRLGVFTARSVDVDVLLDLMIHDLDLLLAMDRSGMKRVDAAGVAIITDKVDIANARFTFNSGCVANVTASRVSAEKMRKFRIFQRDAYFSLDLQQQAARHVFLSFDSGLPEIRHRQVPVTGEQPLQAEIRSFLDTVRTGGQPVVSGEDGKAAVELALLVQERIRAQ